MASEYALQLKATLDTSDVQQKLGQLKQQQQSGQGGVGGGGVQQALQRLNATLTNLQRSIDKLAGQQGKAGGRGTPVFFGQAPRAAAGRPAAVSRTSPLQIGAELRSVQRGLIDAFGLSRRGGPSAELRPVLAELRGFQRHGWTGRRLWERLDAYDNFSAVESWQAREGSPSAFQDRINRYRRQQIASSPILAREARGQAAGPSRMSRQTKANLRMGAGLAFGAIAGGVGNYAQATGNQGLATGAGFVQNIGYGAATGALVGGPIGAVIGGATGALTAAFDELARRAREAASALAEQHKRIFSGQSVDNALADMFRGQKDRQALEKGDRSYFQQQLKSEQELYKKTTESLAKEVGVGGEGLERFNLREYEKETERLMKLRGQDDSEVKRRQNVATLYTANASVLQKSDARIAELERVLKSLGPAPRSPLNKRRADVAAEQAASLKEALEALRAPDMANVNSLASQGFMISQADDEARLEEANKYLADLVRLTREIKDKETEAAVYG